jgi:hypothetical protein
MSANPQPLWLNREGGRVFALYDAESARPRAGILFCPPLLHEYARSYRLFAVLGRALSKAGFGVLRFDYLGTGDSDASDDEFSIESARIDADVALKALRERSEDVPIIVLGIRAGIFPALGLVGRDNIREAWLWQPIESGAEYVQQLQRFDAAERIARTRHQFGHPQRSDCDAHTLMGFPLGKNMLSQLSAANLDQEKLSNVDVTVIAGDGQTSPVPSARCLRLPPALSTWVNEVDIVRFAPKLIERVAGELVGDRAE